MPKKPKPSAPQNPATAAHEGGMDPGLEAKRSGPPPTGGDMTPTSPMPPGPNEYGDSAAPAMDPAEVEAKLKDPTFDPEGHERLRLAEESRSHPSDPDVPVTSDVDARGNPMMPGEKDG